MVSALDSGAIGKGSSSGRGLCVMFLGKTLKGHNQLVHMRIRYHFMANLYTAETRSMLFFNQI